MNSNLASLLKTILSCCLAVVWSGNVGSYMEDEKIKRSQVEREVSVLELSLHDNYAMCTYSVFEVIIAWQTPNFLKYWSDAVSIRAFDGTYNRSMICEFLPSNVWTDHQVVPSARPYLFSFGGTRIIKESIRHDWTAGCLSYSRSLIR
jgi:hypothetical protein